MESKSRFIITPEGSFLREDITTIEVDPGPELEKAFKVNISVKLPKIMVLPTWGQVNLAVEENGIQHWTVTVEDINFNTTFKVKETPEGGELIPLFIEDKLKTEANMVINWNRVKAMSDQSKVMDIRFVAVIMPRPGGSYQVSKQYLYAFDDARNAYRLPISNLYETCELCNGEYNSIGTTAVESLTRALNQFRNSSWNSDLWRDEDLVGNFIRFKPLEVGFETLPIKSNWNKWCTKISTATLKHVII